MLMDKVVKMLKKNQLGDMTVADLYEVFRDCEACVDIMSKFDSQVVLRFKDGSESTI